MTVAEPNDAPDGAEDAKVREEWRRLEQQRLDDEIAEAREDAVNQGRYSRPGWLAWLAFAVALAAGIALTIAVNQGLGPRQ